MQAFAIVSCGHQQLFFGPDSRRDIRQASSSQPIPNVLGGREKLYALPSLRVLGIHEIQRRPVCEQQEILHRDETFLAYKHPIITVKMHYDCNAILMQNVAGVHPSARRSVGTDGISPMALNEKEQFERAQL